MGYLDKYSSFKRLKAEQGCQKMPALLNWNEFYTADTENWSVSKEEIEANHTELCICAENSTTNPHRCRDVVEG